MASQTRYASRKGFRLSHASIEAEEPRYSPTPPRSATLSQRGYYSDIVMKDEATEKDINEVWHHFYIVVLSVILIISL